MAPTGMLSPQDAALVLHAQTVHAAASDAARQNEG